MGSLVRWSGFKLVIYSLLAELLALPPRLWFHPKSNNININLIRLIEDVSAMI